MLHLHHHSWPLFNVISLMPLLQTVNKNLKQTCRCSPAQSFLRRLKPDGNTIKNTLTLHDVPLGTSMGWEDGRGFCGTILWFCPNESGSKKSRGAGGGRGRGRSLCSLIISSIRSVIKKQKQKHKTDSDYKTICF